MPRPLRFFSKSKIYHIILKGIDNQTIFYDDQDRNFFLKQVSITKKEFNYIVYAYCLMGNHVHMVIKCEDVFLSKAIQSLLIRYVHYFNKKYMRIGPLVQNRFKSKNVENPKYFVDVCTYVHRNPENAAIAITQDYEWSSYKEYLGTAKIINKNALLHYFNNDLNEFVNYTTKTIDIKDFEDYAEYELIGKLTDEHFSDIIMKKFNLNDINEIAFFFKNRTRKELECDLEEIKRIKGINKTQVARVLRLGRRTIEKVWTKNNI